MIQKNQPLHVTPTFATPKFAPSNFDKLRDGAHLRGKPGWDRFVANMMKGNMPDDAIPPVKGQELADLKATIRPGDAILAGNNGSFIHGIMVVGKDPLLQAQLEQKWGLPPGALNNETLIIHSLMEDEDAKTDLEGKPVDYKSGGIGVMADTVERFFVRHPRDMVIVKRPVNQTPDQVAKTLAAAKSFVGRNYDFSFETFDDKAMYCTEFVARALKAGHPDFAVPTQHFPLINFPVIVTKWLPKFMRPWLQDRGFFYHEMIMNDGLAASTQMTNVWASQGMDQSVFGTKYRRWAQQAPHDKHLQWMLGPIAKQLPGLMQDVDRLSAEERLRLSAHG